MIQVLPENTVGRDFVIGDLHGCVDLLKKLMASQNFNKKKDRVIMVGDLIDRGSQSLEAIKLLQAPWFFSVKGNHEEFMMLSEQNEFAAESWRKCGGKWADKLTQEDWQYCLEELNALPTIIEFESGGETFGVIHAEVAESCTSWRWFAENIADEAINEQALWGRDRIDNDIESTVSGVSLIFVGHSRAKKGVKLLGNHCYLDTGAVFGGGLSAAIIRDGGIRFTAIWS